MKILVVDDQLSDQEELRFILDVYGTVDTASDGKEAMEAFCYALRSESPYDVVLLDIRMPVMNGQTVLKKMRQAEREMRQAEIEMRQAEMDNAQANPFVPNRRQRAFIIMLTVLEDPYQLMEAFLKGRCNGYLTKPIDEKELLDKLRKNKLIQ